MYLADKLLVCCTAGLESTYNRYQCHRRCDHWPSSFSFLCSFLERFAVPHHPCQFSTTAWRPTSSGVYSCDCFRDCVVISSLLDTLVNLQCESKKSPPGGYLNFFHFSRNSQKFLINFLHTYYTFLCTLDYKFLFNYLQLWRSYAILSMTT